jgi:hypothetical protein
LMADPRAFISFDFDNNENEKNLLAGQCRKDSPTPFSAEDWSSKAPLPQSTWEAQIEQKIGACHVMFVLVSPTSHRAAGVAKEIAMAIRQNVPMCGIYIANASAATPLPTGLPRNRVVGWAWKEIASAVNQMMGEGKNRRR